MSNQQPTIQNLQLIGRGRTAEVYAWDEGQVVKLFHAGWPQNAIDSEERIARLVYAGGLRGPAVFGRVEVDGRTGLIYEWIQGPAMEELMARNPWKLAIFARKLADLQADINAVTYSELPSLKERLDRDIQSAPRLSQTRKKELLHVLASLPDGRNILHFDFHPGNILMSGSRAVIIDWENICDGNPLADVGRTALLIRHGKFLPGTNIAKVYLFGLFRSLFLSNYLHRYFELRPGSQEDMEAWIPVLAAARLREGISQEEDRLLKIAESRK